MLTEFCLNSYEAGLGTQGADCPGMSHPSSELILGSLGSAALQNAWPFIFAVDAMAQAHSALPHAPPSAPAMASMGGEGGARKPLSDRVCAPGTYRVNIP